VAAERWRPRAVRTAADLAPAERIAAPSLRDSDPPPAEPSVRPPLAVEFRRCHCLVAARERICWGVGPEDAAVVVVGEAPAYGHPGADEWRGGNRTGMAYSGRRSGRKIRGTIATLGLAGEAYYTNAVKCYPSAAYAPDGSPTGADLAENRAPTADERARCRPYLREEIDRVAPDCVLATGSHATRSLLAVEGREIDGFLDRVLTLHDCPALGAPVLPLVHPSYREVWIPRLGHDRASYLAAVRERLADCGVAPAADGDADRGDGR
jgi:uracil-DNA glycosylase family 4